MQKESQLLFLWKLSWIFCKDLIKVSLQNSCSWINFGLDKSKRLGGKLLEIQDNLINLLSSSFYSKETKTGNLRWYFICVVSSCKKIMQNVNDYICLQRKGLVSTTTPAFQAITSPIKFTFWTPLKPTVLFFFNCSFYGSGNSRFLSRKLKCSPNETLCLQSSV